MRLLGLILALGAIFWVLYRLAGGEQAQTAIPEAQQRALHTARGVEQSLQDAAQKSLDAAEQRSDP